MAVALMADAQSNKTVVARKMSMCAHINLGSGGKNRARQAENERQQAKIEGLNAVS